MSKKKEPGKALLTPEVRLRKLFRQMDEDPDLRHLKYNRKPAWGHGPLRPLGMVVIEQPEENDEKIGVALTGPGAVVLQGILQQVDLKRADHLYVTAISKWRTPASRNPTVAEAAALLPYLTREIDIVNPEYLVTVGRYVNSLFFPKFGLTGLLGTVKYWRNKFILPTVSFNSANQSRENGQLLLNTFSELVALHESDIEGTT